jgi:hypothetical protein
MDSARILAMLAAVLFLVSLALPAIQGSGFPALDGFAVLRQGASGWRNGVFAWYANPALIASLAATFLGRYRIAVGLASLAMLLALSSFVAGPTAELTGRSVPPFRYGIGFYVWLVAFAVAIAAPLGKIYKESRSTGPA